MAYTSWSVIFGEQPSAAKWNILGTNDASFNDGTGIGAAAIGPSQRTGGFAVGNITTSGTGALSATGLTFTPKMVMFYILPSASGTVNKAGFGAMTTTSQWASASSAVNTPSASRSSATNKCFMAIANASSTVENDAAYTSMNSDGFTVNVTTATTNYTWGYIALG